MPKVVANANPGRLELIAAIASRDFTTDQLVEMFEMSRKQLERFVADNREDLLKARRQIELARAELLSDEATEDDASDRLWIRDQKKRLQVYQTVVEALFAAARITFDSTVLRELRSYMLLAANELGQLQHRGSGVGGDDSSVTYDLPGIDLERLR